MTVNMPHAARPVMRRVRKDRSRYIRLLFLAPALIVSLSVVLVPLVVTVALSFTNWNGFSLPDFIGMSNFQQLFTEPRFWAALVNNLIYTGLYVTLPMMGGRIRC